MLIQKAKLRGHHLICLNFFRGEGYSEDFIRQIYSVINKEELEIVEGPDEVCARCPYLIEYRCASIEFTNEMIIHQDEEALKLLGFRPGESTDWKTISEKIPAIIEEWKNLFCTSCGYQRTCYG